MSAPTQLQVVIGSLFYPAFLGNMSYVAAEKLFKTPGFFDLVCSNHRFFYGIGGLNIQGLKTLLQLPTFTVAGLELYKRLTLIIQDGTVEHVFYPVFPPDRNADEVLAWLRQHG